MGVPAAWDGTRDDYAITASRDVCRLKSILVPVDFSPCSLKALTYAVALAKEFDASVVLLHVAEPWHAGERFASVGQRGQLRQDAAQRLAQLVSGEVSPRVEARWFLREGVPGQVISDFARKICADLIVIATHGYTGLRSVLLGSTTQRVVQHAPCPVLVVRERQHEFITAAPTRKAESP